MDFDAWVKVGVAIVGVAAGAASAEAAHRRRRGVVSADAASIAFVTDKIHGLRNEMNRPMGDMSTELRLVEQRVESIEGNAENAREELDRKITAIHDHIEMRFGKAELRLEELTKAVYTAMGSRRRGDS